METDRSAEWMGNGSPSSVRINMASGMVVSTRKSSDPSLVILGGKVPHHWYQWEE
ncbi:unnamed protein product [Staurois parvus]|uniref:Uncharacterized protein n=1 Tax=Staurois parvus TaxID=386267 RepID=A0ABN9HFI1_9NEOB|nr:unnamed protein product [Staurois parvus]